MEEPVPANTPNFIFATPNYCLTASGLNPIPAAQAWQRLDQADELIVGALPFDPAAAPRLFTATTSSWLQRYQPQVAVPGGNTIVSSHEAADYATQVASAVAAIHAGKVAKVVLGRFATYHCAAPIDVAALFDRLVSANPTAYCYLLDLGGDFLVGASPELVLGIDEKGVASTHPLAGSIPKTGDRQHDLALAQELLADAKSLGEHRYVTDALAATWRQYTTAAAIPATPGLVETPVLWHLGTPITGQLHQGARRSDLIKAIHPTPAVCGWPQQAARQVIAQLEACERGLFAGLVGWAAPTGACEFAMTLRGGLVSGSTATAYAGAGIVAESNPLLEAQETATKLKTFTNALKGSPAC